MWWKYNSLEEIGSCNYCDQPAKFLVAEGNAWSGGLKTRLLCKDHKNQLMNGRMRL
jgi:hypothetical protein